jgi:multidrug resistance efflux pump
MNARLNIGYHLPDTSVRKSLPALKLVQSSRAVRRLAKATLAFLLLSALAMLLLPWQQSSKGMGRVTAFVPQERQQTVTSQVKGIVSRVAEGLVEGTTVKQGDFILELQPAAANLLDQLQSQLQDLRTKMETSRTKVEVYEQNIRDFGDARDFAVKAAQDLIEASRAKLQGKQRMVTGYESKETQARLNYERQKGLFEKGLKPEKEIERLRKDLEVAVSELESARQEVTAAERELDSKTSELEQKRREAQTKVDYARAMREDAIGQQATAQKEMREIEVKISELDRLTITAPRDGTIFRMPIFERGQMIKEGAELFTIVPESTDLAVELWIAGFDAPLVRPNDHVRLQFEGWPAIQFAGWPSVAVGTFGGRVVAIDETDDGKGKFRIQVRPDDPAGWPSHRFLRQGVRANGWVLLQQVSLGYEIWRQLNGFPPVVADSEPAASKDGDEDDDKKKSKVKLPK